MLSIPGDLWSFMTHTHTAYQGQSSAGESRFLSFWFLGSLKKLTSGKVQNLVFLGFFYIFAFSPRKLLVQVVFQVSLIKSAILSRYKSSFYYYYFYLFLYFFNFIFDPGNQFPRNEKITLCNTKKYKNQAGMNLTSPPPSQNGRAVRRHCTAESERRVAEIKS